MGMYENNLALIRGRYPELAVRLDNTADDGTCKVKPSKSGLPTMTLTHEGREIFLHSGYNPLKEAESFIEQKGIKGERIVLFLGFGLGYSLDRLLYGQSRKVRFCIIVEKNIQIFRKCMETINLSNLVENPAIELLVDIPEEELLPRLVAFFKVDFRRVCMISSTLFLEHPVILNVYNSYYGKVMKTFRDSCMTAFHFVGNSPQDSLIGIANMLDNIENIIISPGVNQAYDAFKGRPAVIVAAGPSLDKNVHLLKGIEDRALIIVCDVMLRGILERGIKPHITVSIERDLGMERIYFGTEKYDLSDIWMAFTPVVSQEVFRIYGGPKFIVYRNFAHFKWLGIERGILEIGPSVSLMASKIAEKFGCDPIILIGQDLSYGAAEDTHAEGTVHFHDHVPEETRTFREVIVEGNDGRPVKSNEVWYSMLKSFELDIANFPGTYINATEGGAKITGAKVMPLQEVIDQYMQEPFDPVGIIRQQLVSPDQERQQNEMQRLWELCNTTDGLLQTTINLCKKALGRIEKLEKKLNKKIAAEGPFEVKDIDPKILIEAVAELEKIKHHMINDSELFYLFLMHYVQSFLLKKELDLMSIHNKKETTSEQLFLAVSIYQDMFKTLINLVKVIMKPLARARDSVAEKIGPASGARPRL
ncbi:MAG: motility associated factor glycosyltransferase family protein [Deltaproteobacteria bacterium]|nr:motility associated factor glycosyltransferase family protein [Deltaproteobacteria bacterium]